MAFTLTEPPENRVHAPLNLPGAGLSLSRYGPYQHVSSSVDGGPSQGPHGRVRAALGGFHHDVGPPRGGRAMASQPGRDVDALELPRRDVGAADGRTRSASRV